MAAVGCRAAQNPPESDGDDRFGWAQTFYPGVTDPQLAEPVILGTGSEQWSPDIKLATVPVHRVRGRILDVCGGPAANASVALDKGYGPGLAQTTKDDGTFEFATVPKAEWRLSARAEVGGVKLRAARFIAIKKEDLDQIELPRTVPFTLQGKLVMEVPDGMTAPEPPIIDMELASETALLSDTERDTSVHIFSNFWDEGNLTVRDMYPGSYQVQPLTDSSSPYYLDSMRLGDRDAMGWVEIASNAEPLVITYKLGGGTVHGSVEGCNTGDVFLIPREVPLRRAGLLRVTKCSENGRFEFPAVRPGEYFGFAMAGEGSWGFHFADLIGNDDLLKQASSVRVRANESTSVQIQVTAR